MRSVGVDARIGPRHTGMCRVVIKRQKPLRPRFSRAQPAQKGSPQREELAEPARPEGLCRLAVASTHKKAPPFSPRAALPFNTDLFGLPHAGVNYGFIALGMSGGSILSYIGAQALPLAARHWLAGICAAAGLICVSLVKPVENG